MALLAVSSVFLLLIVMGIAGATIYLHLQNKKNAQRTIIRPFSGKIDPTSKSPVALVTKDNTPQITCPAGSKVNIIGAWVEVNDPYSTCTPTPAAIFKRTCGYDKDQTNTGAPCQYDSDCPNGMSCDKGYCLASTCAVSSGGAPNCGENTCPTQPETVCKTDTDCGRGLMCASGKCMVIPGGNACNACKTTPGGGSVCVPYPTCSNLDANYNNITCGPSSSCRPRDASAYLASVCDGQQECNVTWDFTKPDTLGPLPCQISVNGDVNYATLPITPGRTAGAAPGGSQDYFGTYQQGYYVHGIYTCVPDDE